jgi:phosphoglycerol transferase MdoB-like AlkP superfamily enzyme
MNLALGAIIFAILLIPPLILIYVYGKGTHARGIPKLSLVEYLLLSAVLSLFLHGAAIHIFNLDINYPFLVQFLSGQLNDADVNKNGDHYRSYFIGFAKYIFWLCLFAWAVGNILKFIATSRRLRMNRMLQWFRNDRKPNDMVAYFNNWWYTAGNMKILGGTGHWCMSIF